MTIKREFQTTYFIKFGNIAGKYIWPRFKNTYCVFANFVNKNVIQNPNYILFAPSLTPYYKLVTVNTKKKNRQKLLSNWVALEHTTDTSHLHFVLERILRQLQYLRMFI
jgi:hypothetical protein